MEHWCPYCREELTEHEIYYLFHWSKDEYARQETTADGENSYGGLIDFLKTYEESSDKRKDERFERVWKYYAYTRDSLLFSPNDMILSQEEVGMLKRWMDNPEQPAESGWRKPFLAPAPIAGKNPELLRSAPVVTENIMAGEEKKGKKYFYEKKNPEDEFDDQMDIAYGIRDHVIAKLRRVCGNCFNLVPEELYRHPTVKVYLMAGPASGKTCMLYSVFLHQDEFNRKNRDYMRWESIQDITVDPFFNKFFQDAKAFGRDMEKVDPTQVKFIPPLFLKVTYSGQTLILALYDNGGEIFLDDKKVNWRGEDEGKDKGKEEIRAGLEPKESVSQAREFGELFNRKIKGMDVLLCILSPEEDETEGDAYELRLGEEDLHKILEGSRIYSEEEQARIERNPLEKERTIRQVLEEMSGINSMKKRKNREILKILEERLGGESSIRKILGGKYLGIVISKIDLISRSGLIPTDENSLFFEDEGNYFTEEEEQRKTQRDWRMRDMLDSGRLLEYDLDRFRICNYHFIASYIAGRKELSPIRVEEPLVDIVRDYFREREL